VALGAVEQKPGDSGLWVVDEQRHECRSVGFRPNPAVPARRTGYSLDL
jgi:hypothetical protein